jgi:hypothetical protein
MTKTWDHQGRRVVDEDGRHTYVPFLASTEQVRRWIAVGYDLAGVVTRTEAFAAAFRATASFDEAQALLEQHLKREAAVALAEGVAADDPDFWRIARAARAYEFDPVT